MENIKLKYKLKFEIDYESMDKSEIRDSKINSIINDKSIYCYEIDPNAKIPSKGDSIVIGGVKYIAVNMDFHYDENYCIYVYTIIKSNNSIKKRNKSRISDYYDDDDMFMTL